MARCEQNISIGQSLRPYEQMGNNILPNRDHLGRLPRTSTVGRKTRRNINAVLSGQMQIGQASDKAVRILRQRGI